MLLVAVSDVIGVDYRLSIATINIVWLLINLFSCYVFVEIIESFMLLLPVATIDMNAPDENRTRDRLIRNKMNGQTLIICLPDETHDTEQQQKKSIVWSQTISLLLCLRLGPLAERWKSNLMRLMFHFENDLGIDACADCNIV